MRLKKRYLFPIIYAALFALAFIAKIEGLLMVLIAPMSLLMIGLEIAVGQQFGDDFYLLAIAGLLQYFVIGLIWDKIAESLGSST